MTQVFTLSLITQQSLCVLNKANSDTNYLIVLSVTFMLEWSDLIKIFFFNDLDQILQTDWLLLLIKVYYYFIGWERTEGGRGLLIDILGRFVARGGDVCSKHCLVRNI